jgi:hypothetical protein
MKSYRFWLDQLSDSTRQILLAQPSASIIRYYFDRGYTGFRHGETLDWNDNNPLLQTIRAQSHDVFQSPKDNVEPTAVEVWSDWPDLPWLLLQIDTK